MQIASLKVYCDLAETESFTKAAFLNHVTQSAVSQQISALERQFQSRLIERSKKQFRLTQEGEVLYDFGKQIVRTYEALRGELDDMKEIVSGTIRVAAIYSVGLHTLPPYVQTFLKAYPAANVHLEYSHAAQIYEDVLGNVVDLGVVAFPGRDHRVETVPLMNEPMVLICPPDHPLARGAAVRMEALAHERFVAFEAEIPTRKATDRVLKEHGVAVRPALEFDNIETIKRAVEIGSGVAIVPRTTVTQEVALGTLAQVPLEGVHFSRRLAVIYKKHKLLSPAMRRFLALLKEKASGVP